jgi:hypothetical protein
MPPEWLVKIAAIAGGLTGPIALVLTLCFRRADRPQLRIDVGQTHYEGAGRGANLPGVGLVNGPYVLADTTLKHEGGRETTINLVQMRFRAGRWRATAHRTLWTEVLPRKLTAGEKVPGCAYGEIRKLPLPPEVRDLHVRLTFRHAFGRARTDFIVEVPPEPWKR